MAGAGRRFLSMVQAHESPRVLVQGARARTPSKFQHAACYAKSTDLTVVEGKGCYVTDVHGRQYLDATSGIAVLSTGHCHPRVVEAVQMQAASLMHGQLNCFQSHTALDRFLDKLGTVMPHADLNAFVVDTTGTQAIEAAVKLARRHTNRPNIICLHGGFHGRSALTSAMTSSNTGPRFPVATPLPSGVYFTTPPLPFRWGVSEAAAVKRAVEALEDLFRSQVPGDQVAAFVCEPVLGEGGFIPLPEPYLYQVSQLCRKYGILMIADEIQAGAGRTGNMWATQLSSAEAFRPDILVSAKGIASGMPLSVLCSSREILDSYVPGSHGGTYMGNAVACAAAAATLDVIEEEGLVENAAKQGNLMKKMLQKVVSAYFPGSDVRGEGLMIGIEFRHNGEGSPELAKFVKQHALTNSHLILYAPSGWDGCTMRVMPPLIIQEPDILHIVSAFEAAGCAWNAKHKHSDNFL